MKTTFAFVGKRDYKAILDLFKTNFNKYDTEVIFLTKENLEPSDFQDDELNNKFLIFDDKSTENEMIEYLFQNESLNKVFVFKESYQNVNFADISRMFNESYKKDVIISKRNKEKNFFHKILTKIREFVFKFVLGFQVYDGEADIVALSPLASSIVKQSPGKSSMFCNLNSWSGVKVSECLITNQTTIKNNNKTTFPLGLLISSGVLLLMILGHFLFSIFKIKLPFLALITYILVEVVLFLTLLLSLIKFSFYKKFGKINFINQAVLVKTINNTL